MRRDGKEFLEVFLDGSYVTAGEIAEKFHVSPKTVRLRIKELNEIGKNHGFVIISKPRFGYRLENINEKAAENFYKSQRQKEDKIPESAEERTDFLLAYLISHKTYIKIDQLCEFLYVSRATLQISIKQTEQIVNQYGIVIERRPNFGLRMKGAEFDFRRCIGDYFVRRNLFSDLDENRKGKELKSLGDMALSLMKEYDIHMAETSFDIFIHHVYIALKRIRSGFFTELLDQENISLSQEEWSFIWRFTETLAQVWNVKIEENEKNYIALYLAGKRTIELEQAQDQNFVVGEEIGQLADLILNVLLDEFNVDLRGDFHIRMMLSSHLVPLAIRIQYGISNVSQILEEVKKNYAFPYTMAVRTGEILEEKFKKEISPDEVSYFAVIYALALEEMKGKTRKKSNILIVCNSGKGSSRLLLYKYREEFGEYLNRIYICDMVGLNTFDFSKVDYVFITIPISRPIPVPIVEVGLFLETRDLVQVKNTLKSSRKAYLSHIYRPERFFTEIKGTSKEEVLENLCIAIGKREKLPEGFLESVLIREGLGQTDFGNHVAMPHPHKLLAEETKVFVAVLKQPVFWTKNTVQAVFLASIGNRQDECLPHFYEATARAMQSREGMERLIKEKTFKVLMDILDKG